MQDAKEEVRSRLNIEDVVGEYVQLKRAGRNFKGLSPFTSEKTPSFTVSPDKHIWHDFSSGKGGDVFSFVMEVEGLDFRAALEQLARKAGVDLSQYDSKQSGEIAKKKKRLLELSELAASYFQYSLKENTHALTYTFKKRGLSKEIVQEFRLGYAPDSGDALIRFLFRKGFSKQELRDGGVVNRFDSDLFRGRLMVPLMDASGQVIGFTGRIIEDIENAPKYLNTPQTLLYDKSRHVFGLSQAKEAIRKGDRSVVVEGNLDVVSSHQYGVKEVVATAGTALSEHHLKALSRLSHNIRLSFDGDKAGLAATERAIGIAETVGVALTIVTLPDEAKDPDELVKQDPALWTKAIDAAAPVVDWILKQYSERLDVTTAAGKREFTSTALRVIARLGDKVEQEHYQQKVATITDSSLDTIKAKQAAGDSQTQSTRLKQVKSSADAPKHINSFEDNLLAAALIDANAQELLESTDSSIFTSPERQMVAEFLQKHGGRVVSDTPVSLQSMDTYVKILLLRAETRYGDWDDKDRYFEIAHLLRQLEKEHKKKQKNDLTLQLRDAEELGDDSAARELRTKINQLIKEISRG